MIRTIVFAGVALIASCAALGQSASALPEFEVASVRSARPLTGNDIGVSMGRSPGRVTYTNVTLKNVIMTAYGVKAYQISGPDWLNNERYDIVAKLPDGAPKDQIPLMLQRLLLERFRLSLHREKKELSVYALMIGKDGPKLQKADGGGGTLRRGRGHLEAQMMSISGLANALSGVVDRVVLDMTELKGRYNFSLEWTEEGEAGAGSDNPPLRSGPAIFTALQEQLGLKLQARKALVEIIIIDRAQKVPTDN